MLQQDSPLQRSVQQGHVPARVQPVSAWLVGRHRPGGKCKLSSSFHADCHTRARMRSTRYSACCISRGMPEEPARACRPVHQRDTRSTRQILPELGSTALQIRACTHGLCRCACLLQGREAGLGAVHLHKATSARLPARDPTDSAWFGRHKPGGAHCSSSPSIQTVTHVPGCAQQSTISLTKCSACCTPCATPPEPTSKRCQVSGQKLQAEAAYQALLAAVACKPSSMSWPASTSARGGPHDHTAACCTHIARQHLPRHTQGRKFSGKSCRDIDSRAKAQISIESTDSIEGLWVWRLKTLWNTHAWCLLLIFKLLHSVGFPHFLEAGTIYISSLKRINQRNQCCRQVVVVGAWSRGLKNADSNDERRKQ